MIEVFSAPSYEMQIKNTNKPQSLFVFYLAEGTGFEPAVLLGTPAFQASTFDHSDTLPYRNNDKKEYNDNLYTLTHF